MRERTPHPSGSSEGAHHLGLSAVVPRAGWLDTTGAPVRPGLEPSSSGTVRPMSARAARLRSGAASPRAVGLRSMDPSPSRSGVGAVRRLRDDAPASLP